MGAVDLHGKGRSLLAEKGPTPGSVAPNALDNVPLASIEAIEGRWYEDGQEEREPLNDWGEGRIPGWGFASIRNNVDPPSGHLPYNLQGQGRGACWLGRGNDGGARESTRLQRQSTRLQPAAVQGARDRAGGRNWTHGVKDGRSGQGRRAVPRCRSCSCRPCGVAGCGEDDCVHDSHGIGPALPRCLPCTAGGGGCGGDDAASAVGSCCCGGGGGGGGAGPD
jgi:hypothetical protein